MKLLQQTLVACATATSAALIAGAVAAPADAATAIGVNGFRGGHVGEVLQGWAWQGATQRVNVDYSDAPFWMDSSIANGVDALVSLMARTPDVDRLVGSSQAALVIIAALREHPEIMPDSGLTVYLIGNPGRARTGGSVRYNGAYVPILGLTNKGAIRQDLPGLSVIDVAFAYDLVADSPNPANFLAVMNAALGGIIWHAAYGDVDMTDPDILVRQIGNTTQYLLPVDRLPLLAGLYNFGLTALADAIAPGLRAMIEAGHDREGYVRLGSLPQSQRTPVPENAGLPSASALPGSIQVSQQFAPDEWNPQQATFSLTTPTDSSTTPTDGTELSGGDPETPGPLQEPSGPTGTSEPALDDGSEIDGTEGDLTGGEDDTNEGDAGPDDGVGAVTTDITSEPSGSASTGDEESAGPADPAGEPSPQSGDKPKDGESPSDD